jgi:purine-binding chemotaxis protein CheW
MLVDEVPGVLNLPGENIEAAPELIQTKIKKDYIKGIGKIDNKLIVILDLGKVLAPQEVEEVATLRTRNEKQK